DAGIKPAQGGDDALRRGARGQGPLGRLLDRGPVHDGVGERDPDLDRIGAGGGDGGDDLGPVVAQTAGDVGHEELAAGVARVAQTRLERADHFSRKSMTWATSL